MKLGESFARGAERRLRAMDGPLLILSGWTRARHLAETRERLMTHKLRASVLLTAGSTSHAEPHGALATGAAVWLGPPPDSQARRPLAGS